MPDSLDKLWTKLLAVATFTATMAVLVAGIALVLGATAHDWYATGKLTVAEALIVIGFDEFALTEYRTVDGETLRLSRYGLTIGEAWTVRARMLSMAADRAVLGACTGLAVAIMWLRTRKAWRSWWPGRSNAVARSAEMRGPYWPAGSVGAGGRIGGQLRRGGERARIGLPVVSEAEFESLPDLGTGIDLAGGAPTAGSGPDWSAARPEALAAARVPALPPADAAEQLGVNTGTSPAKTDGAEKRTPTPSADRRGMEPPAAKSRMTRNDDAGTPAHGGSNPGAGKAGGHKPGSGPGQDFY